MLTMIASSIMPRTTVTIDASVLRALKKRAKEEGKSLGQVISEIAAPALRAKEPSREAPTFRWITKDMGARVDLADKEALRRAMGEE
jgi:hypothetical protein